VPLTDEILRRMAVVLEVEDAAAVAKLSKRVKAALDEYWYREGTPTSAKLQGALKSLSKQCDSLRTALHKLSARQHTRLQGAARRQIDDAARRLSEPRPEGQFPESFEALTQSVASVSVVLRHAAPPRRTRSPQQKRQRARSPQQTAVRHLVSRLGGIYFQTTNHLPTRRHDAIRGEDYGPFREFVTLAFEAAGLSGGPPDSLIKCIWGGLTKKIRARKNYGD
jgi:hypothetical protein